MGIFTNDESVEPTPTPKKSARRKNKSSFSRSTQVVVSTPTPSSISSIFTSNSAQAVGYSTPRSLTAAAAQLKINDKGEYEQFRTRRAAGSSAWQA